MNTLPKREKPILSLLVACILAAFAMVLHPLHAQNAESPAMQAFHLRMSGNVDSALNLIETAIEADGNDAAAQFELARIKTHMMLGNPRKYAGSLDEIMGAVEKAMKLDPQNVAYAYFGAGVALMQGYMVQHANQEDATKQFAKVQSFYDKALELKPDYVEAALDKVELLVFLAQTNKDVLADAEALAAKIEEMNPLAGAQARELLLDDDADYVAYWKDFISKNGESAGASAALARIYAMQGSLDSAEIFYKQSYEMDAGNTIVLLDLARASAMYGMQHADSKDAMLATAAAALEKYLSTDPIAPLKAYAMEIQAKMAKISGDADKAMELRKAARKLDPYYSMAFGVPGAELYAAPGEIVHQHRYLFSPF